MNLLGKTSIHPFFFYTGKFAGYLVRILFILSFFSPFHTLIKYNFTPIIYTTYGLLGTGLIIIILSLIHLGKSTRLGLPTEETKLKTYGIYKRSRNPMYLGFDLTMIAAIVYTGNIRISILAISSIITYHFIIQGEEHFLEKRFGKEYSEYKKRVRRYL